MSRSNNSRRGSRPKYHDICRRTYFMVSGNGHNGPGAKTLAKERRAHKNITDEEEDFFEHLEQNDAEVRAWPQWKRDAQGCKMGAHQS